MNLIALIMFVLIVVSWIIFIKWRKTRRFALSMLAGLGLMIVLSIPASLIQTFWILGGIPAREIPVVAAVATPFNVGGLVMRASFEALVEPLEFLVGHRSATVLSNASFYAFLLMSYIVILSALFAWIRYKRPEPWRLWIAVWASAVLINSLANVKWPWWGT